MERVVPPVTPGHSNHADNLSLVKRLKEHIITAEIQHFGPQCFVGGPRYNQDRRGIGTTVYALKDVLPAAIGEVTLANYDRRSVSSDVPFSLRHGLNKGEIPLNVMENPAECR